MITIERSDEKEPVALFFDFSTDGDGNYNYNVHFTSIVNSFLVLSDGDGNNYEYPALITNDGYEFYCKVQRQNGELVAIPKRGRTSD
jgi:hypothetical protein